ncbi:MAG: DUF2800 domain-containing protein [Candidatus Gracilibacteria bacterium]|nr:DUF2800 domain-containing protein [Candidatus Gracilibacteria bacterium]
MAEKKHSDLAPSAAARWMNCPGSIALSAKMPKEESSSYAKEGTVAHEVLERCLKDPSINPYDMEGLEIDDFEVDEEMCDGVSFTVDEVRKELQKGGTLLVEQQAEIVPGKIGGTLDIAIIKEFEKIIVADFKYGKGIDVSAVENPQLMLYALPLIKKYDVPEVEFIIYQPRKMDSISRWTCSVEDLEDFEKEVLRCIELTEEPNAFTTPGTWCRWCRAKAICPAVRGDISKALVEVQGKEVIFPDVEGLPATAVVRILDIRDTLEKWLDAVTAYAQRTLEEGGSIPGYELAKKRANRVWIDEAKALAEFSDLEEKAFKVKIISPAQMEKLAGKERVAKLVEIPDTGLTIKRVKETKKKVTKKKKGAK